jgi:hypothetical protein
MLEYVHSGQIKGLDVLAARELSERRYDTSKTSGGIRLKVESKDDMKKRIQRSPDDADCVAVMIELARDRHHFFPIGLQGKRAEIRDGWKDKAKLVNRVYNNIQYAEV